MKKIILYGILISVYITCGYANAIPNGFYDTPAGKITIILKNDDREKHENGGKSMIDWSKKDGDAQFDQMISNAFSEKDSSVIAYALYHAINENPELVDYSGIKNNGVVDRLMITMLTIESKDVRSSYAAYKKDMSALSMPDVTMEYYNRSIKDITKKLKSQYINVSSAPKTATAKSLDDFFSTHPQLRDNVFTRNAVTTQAKVATLNDVMAQKKKGEMSGNVIQRLLNENGYNYALLAMRQLSTVCRGGAGESLSLKPDDCKLIIKNTD